MRRPGDLSGAAEGDGGAVVEYRLVSMMTVLLIGRFGWEGGLGLLEQEKGRHHFLWQEIKDKILFCGSDNDFLIERHSLAERVGRRLVRSQGVGLIDGSHVDLS